MPGFSATCDGRGARQLVGLAGDEAVEREAGLRRARSAAGRRRRARRRGCGRRARRVSATRASTRRTPISRPLASAARRSMRAAKRSRTSSSTKRLGAVRTSVSLGRARFGRERPDPGIELLRGQLLLQSPQARVPEVLHLLVGLNESKFYSLRYALSTARVKNARANAFSS